MTDVDQVLSLTLLNKDVSFNKTVVQCLSGLLCGCCLLCVLITCTLAFWESNFIFYLCMFCCS